MKHLAFAIATSSMQSPRPAASLRRSASMTSTSRSTASPPRASSTPPTTTGPPPNSSDGSAAWTEAVVNLTCTARVQASASASRPATSCSATTATRSPWTGRRPTTSSTNYIGFRAGKVKTPTGLFNDIQDIDPAYLWILLPQSIYPLPSRNSNAGSLWRRRLRHHPCGRTGRQARVPRLRRRSASSPGTTDTSVLCGTQWASTLPTESADPSRAAPSVGSRPFEACSWVPPMSYGQRVRNRIHHWTCARAYASDNPQAPRDLLLRRLTTATAFSFAGEFNRNETRAAYHPGSRPFHAQPFAIGPARLLRHGKLPRLRQSSPPASTTAAHTI